MTDIKSKVQSIDPNLKARAIEQMVKESGNVYETLAVVTKRAKQLNMDIKKELHGKLDEFAIVSDTIEEVQENKEQIEISKFYERLPNPTIIALKEFLDDELEYEFRTNEDKGEAVVED